MQERFYFIRHATHGIAHSADTALNAVHDAHDHVLAPLQGFGRKARDEGNRLVKAVLYHRHNIAHGSADGGLDVIEHRGNCIFYAVNHSADRVLYPVPNGRNYIFYSIYHTCDRGLDCIPYCGNYRLYRIQDCSDCIFDGVPW